MSHLDAQLETLLQVARLGSFRRAVDELFVTRARIVDADGGNALTPVGLVLNQILGLPQWSGVVPVISAII